MDTQLINRRLTIVMPVYNEAEVIEAVVRDLYEKVIQKIPTVEFIIAEDGSTDGTKEILKTLNKEIPFVLISGRDRKGFTKAFKDALAIAKTDLVFFSDSDGQHDPADIFTLLKEIDNYDIVSGIKSPRRDPIHRVVISRIYNLLLYLLFGLKMKDIDSGFKLIKKKVIDNVLNEVMSLKYCVMSEFILKAYLKGYRIKEVPVIHYSRKSGTTNIFNPKELLFIILQIIKGLLEIKFSLIRLKKI